MSEKRKRITFSPLMSKRTLQGRKTETRRLMKQPIGNHNFFPLLERIREMRNTITTDQDELRRMEGLILAESPRQVGDILDVREEYYQYGSWMKGPTSWMFVPTLLEESHSAPCGPIFPEFIEESKVKGIGAAKRKPFEAVQLYRRTSMYMPTDYSRYAIKVKKIGFERLDDITDESITREGFKSRYEFVSTWNAIHVKDKFETCPWVWVVSYSLAYVEVKTAEYYRYPHEHPIL